MDKELILGKGPAGKGPAGKGPVANSPVGNTYPTNIEEQEGRLYLGHSDKSRYREWVLAKAPIRQKAD